MIFKARVGVAAISLAFAATACTDSDSSDHDRTNDGGDTDVHDAGSDDTSTIADAGSMGNTAEGGSPAESDAGTEMSDDSASGDGADAGPPSGDDLIDSGIESPNEQDDSGSPPTPDDAATTAALQVQDMWILHQANAVLDDGSVVDVLQQLTELAFDDAQDAVAISSNATFRPAPGLAVYLQSLDGEIRSDVSVIGGVIESDDAVMVTFFASAGPGVTLPNTNDMLLFNLPDIAGVEAGMPLVFDYQFVQVLPDPEADATTDLDDPLAVLAARLLAESYQTPATGDPGDPDDLVMTGQAGQVYGAAGISPASASRFSVAGGSDDEKGGLPPKAKPFFDSFNGGFGKCLKALLSPTQRSLKCIKDVMDGQLKGARGTNDLLNGNLGGESPPEPWAPNPPVAECIVNCASANGDPHIYTFDRQHYDLQLVGEFVAARSDQVEVQMRTGPVRDSRRVSFVTAVALGVDGHVIEVPTGAEHPIFVDGETLELPPAGSEPLSLDDIQIWWRTSGIDVWYAGDALMRINRNVSHLDFYLQVQEESSWVGLFGDGDGNANDGLTSRNGEVVETRQTDELYDVFGNSWRVTPEESLFTYDAGESTTTFTDLTFPDEHVSVATLDPAARAHAAAVCQMAGVLEQPSLDECILDYAMTRDIGMIRTAQASLAAKRAHLVDDHSTLDGFVPNDSVIFLGDTSNEPIGGELAVGDGLALIRTDSSGDSMLHAIDTLSGHVRWTVGDVDFRCRPVVVDGLGVAVQLDRSLDEESRPPMVLLSAKDGSELARAEEAPSTGCLRALSADGSIVVQTTRTAVYAYDAANGMQQIWSAEPSDIHWEYAPAVSGHFIVWGRDLGVDDPLTLRSYDPLTGDEVDTLTLVGGDHRQLDLLGNGRLAITANMSADGPIATSVIRVDEDGTFSQVWSTTFDSESETPQPLRLAPLDDLVVGWTTQDAGDVLVAYEAANGDFAWTYRPLRNDPSSGLVEPINFGSAVAFALIEELWLELVDRNGRSAGSIEVAPIDGYLRPQQLTTLPDGRFIVSGRYSADQQGVYVHFVDP